jgi:hypothetical protein
MHKYCSATKKSAAVCLSEIPMNSNVPARSYNPNVRFKVLYREPAFTDAHQVQHNNLTSTDDNEIDKFHDNERDSPGQQSLRKFLSHVGMGMQSN